LAKGIDSSSILGVVAIIRASVYGFSCLRNVNGVIVGALSSYPSSREILKTPSLYGILASEPISVVIGGIGHVERISEKIVLISAGIFWSTDKSAVLKYDASSRAAKAQFGQGRIRTTNPMVALQRH
jgi:hypothetical protein